MASSSKEKQAEHHHKSYLNELGYAQRRLDEWTRLMEAASKHMKPLTEDEWLAACRHFNKCALCKAESIDARGFFMPFSRGGRYAAWNIIPVCEKCAISLKETTNPFIKYNRKICRNKAYNLSGIVSYLKPILEEAGKSEEHGGTQKSL